jgi:hypothetical protein
VLAIRRRLQRILIGRGRATAAEGSIGRQPSRRRRRSSARKMRLLLDAASWSLDASLFPHPDWEAPLLLRTEVVWACRPALPTINVALDDPRQPIVPAALRRLTTFLTDPSASPLFGTNPTAARRAAERLQRSFTGYPNANHQSRYQ